MLRILYGLMIMKLSESVAQDIIDRSIKFGSMPQQTTFSLQLKSIKIPVTLNQNVTFFCNRVDVSWWKRKNILDTERQLISTRSGKVMKQFEKKYELTTNKIDENDHNHQQQLQSRLTLRNASVNDEGYYECECLRTFVHNGEASTGVSSRFHTRYQLEVTAPITNLKLTMMDQENFILNGKESTVGIKENTIVRVLCEAKDAKPRPDVGIVPHDFLSEKKLVWRSSTDGLLSSSLSGTFEMTRMLDGQSIYCWSSNAISNVSSDFARLELLTSPRCLKEGIAVIDVSVGSEVIINCTMVNANPPVVDFVWDVGGCCMDYEEGRWSTNSAFVTIKVAYENAYSTISCNAKNVIGEARCVFQLNLGGAPDPPFGCTTTQTNTTLTISCQAGFHQGDPDYFCYLETLDQTSQNFVELARKKQSCVFLLTDFHAKGLHTYRLYTENRYGNNKPNSILLTIVINTKRWRTLSIGVIVMVALVTTVVLLCVIIYRCSAPSSNHLEFASLVGTIRDQSSYSTDDRPPIDNTLYHNAKGKLPVSNANRIRNWQKCEENRSDFADNIEDDDHQHHHVHYPMYARRQPKKCFSNQDLSQTNDMMMMLHITKSNDDYHHNPSNLQRRSSDSKSNAERSEMRSAMTTANKSFTFDNVSAHCRPCKCVLYNPRSEDSLMCEHKEQSVNEYRYPRTYTLEPLQSLQQQHCSKNRNSVRCKDGGVFV